jgi:hypothetical protein
MSDAPDYIKHIDSVARANSTVLSYEAELILSWQEFESKAAKLPTPYDVLCSDMPPYFISFTREFVTLLYRNDDSSPQQDCDQIREKNAAYGGSWHKRGGTGAFHAFARKGDRLLSMLEIHQTLEQCRKDKTNSESIDDTIGDLRRYLILMLAWHAARPPVHKEYVQPGTMEDGNDEPEVQPEPICTCGHDKGTHDRDGCNGITDGAICSCARFHRA